MIFHVFTVLRLFYDYSATVLRLFWVYYEDTPPPSPQQVSSQGRFSENKRLRVIAAGGFQSTLQAWAKPLNGSA